MPNHSHSQGHHHGRSKDAPAAETADRRNAERFPFSAVADITEVSSRSKVSVRIADIGRMGCYADSLSVFPMGTHVQLRIRHAGEICQIAATVIYSLSGMGMGLNFAPLAPNMEAILIRWLAEARGEPPSPDTDTGTELATAPAIDRAAPPPRAAAAASAQAASAEQRVLARLIKLMMRKGLLNDSECKDLLDEMSERRRNGDGV